MTHILSKEEFGLLKEETGATDNTVDLNCEMRFVGAIYNNPDILVDYSYHIRSKYDFAGVVTSFLYDCADLMYKTRYQTFTEANVISFMQENTDRWHKFKNFGGWETIQYCVSIASKTEEEHKKAFNEIKKYSLMREYQRGGFDVSWIQDWCRKRNVDFSLLSPQSIYRNMRMRADKIQTKIMGDSDIEILNSNVANMVDGCLNVPDMGFKIPFKILNDTFMGMQKKTTMALAAMSNQGKSRLMILLVAYATLVLHRRTLVLLNEMTIDKMRRALLTTVINNNEFRQLYYDEFRGDPDFEGAPFEKPEREIVMGQYREDLFDEILVRETDKDGNFTESFEGYLQRLEDESREYRCVKKIANWIDRQTDGLIFVKDVSADYSDSVLEFEIRKAATTRGIELFFYDTCKNENTGEWSSFKVTVQRLSELCKPLNIFGYLSIQLNDETNSVAPDKMNSSCIAEAKHIKHVLDSLIMIKEIPREDFHKFRYDAKPEDVIGEPSRDGTALNPSKRYYCFVIDKNRGGEKPIVIFEVDLNKNTWKECGLKHIG